MFMQIFHFNYRRLSNVKIPIMDNDHNKQYSKSPFAEEHNELGDHCQFCIITDKAY